MMSNDNNIEEIKSRCNIVDVIGKVVVLKRTGSNFKGLCPFHNEKTPSFVVSEQKQIFTCFGCGASGDVIEFTRRYYNLDFVEAMEKLANEYGITLTQRSSGDKSKDKLYEINREAAVFFYKAFFENPNQGYQYMKGRGIQLEILKKFGIGYADNQRDSLYKHLTQKGYNREDLLSIGLISTSEGKYYDKFRNRVIFPIINTRGKVIGFGGRAIDKDVMPKYLNSPESSVFLKKNNLYGLNLTKNEVQKEDYIILVEGYMDVISLYEQNVRNVAASLGTALTENQARLIKRYTDKVILSYDADDAGRAATLRGSDILYKAGIKAKILNVTGAKDPDEFIQKNGKKAFLDLVKAATPTTEYKIETAKAGLDIEETDGMLEFIKRAVKVLSELRPAEADIYVRKIAADNKISEGALRKELSLYQGNNPEPVYGQYEEKVKTRIGKEISTVEKLLIKLAVTEQQYFNKMIPYNHAFESEKGRYIYETMKKLFDEKAEITIDNLKDSLDEEHFILVADIYENTKCAGKEETIFDDCIKSVEIRDLKKREAELLTILQIADEEENTENIVKITEEIMKIRSLINALGGCYDAI